MRKTMKMKQGIYNIVVATDEKGGIAKNGQIPWKIPSELKYFNSITTANPPKRNTVIMGRKTWESIPEKYRPLVDRKNIVLTLSKHLYGTGPWISDSFSEAVSLGEWFSDEWNDGDIFIIGGESVYKQALADPRFDTLWLSRIPGDYGCDQFFDMGEGWTLSSETDYSDFTAFVYVRR